ncbi:MAG: hypothetical protein ACKO7W_18675 [Elainella sp.]
MGFFHQAATQRVAQTTARKRAAQQRALSRPGSKAVQKYRQSSAKPGAISNWLKRLVGRN